MHTRQRPSASRAPVFLRLLDGWRRWGRRWRWRRRRRCSQGGAHARRVQVHDNGCEVVGQIPKAFLALGHACLEECMHLRRKRARARTVPVSSPPTLVRRSQNHTLLFPCSEHTRHEGRQYTRGIQSRSDGEWGCGEGPCETRTDNRVTLTDRDTEGKVRSLFYDLTLSPLYATRPKQ